MSRAAAAIAIALLGLGAACGLDVTGQAQAVVDGGAPAIDGGPLEAATLDSGGSDAAEDATDDAPDDVVAIDSGGETDCLDGIDNDGNGVADCADPQCSAVVTCLPAAAPAGWVGYAVVRDDTGASCPSGYPQATDAFAVLNAPAATCSACSCTANGIACGTSTTLKCDSHPQCAMNPSTNLPVGVTCTTSNFNLKPSDACEATAIAPSGVGRCDASPVGATKAPATFTKTPRVCGAPRHGAGCSAGNVCVARGGNGFSGACIARSIPDGASPVACPAGFASKALVTSPTASSFVDTRDCTACACGGAPSGASCQGSVTLYTSADCSSGAAGAIPGDSTCRPNVVSAGTSVQSVKATIVAGQGTCAPPTGGQPTGSAHAITQTQYCCQ